MEHHLAGQIECSMVGLRELLIATTIIEEIPVDPMELLMECQMAYLIVIQVESLLTTMTLCQERVGVGMERSTTILFAFLRCTGGTLATRLEVVVVRSQYLYSNAEYWSTILTISMFLSTGILSVFKRM
jgi:hypothetical protein